MFKTAYYKEILYENLPALMNTKGELLVYNPYKGIILQGRINSVDDNLSIDNFTDTPRNHHYDPVFPHLALVVTKDCNLSCRYCYAYGGWSKERMSLEIADAAVNYVLSKKSKKIKIAFTGGEPTLCPDLIKHVVDNIEKRGFESLFVINTNGVIKNNMLEYLIEKNFVLHISMDGPPHIHDKNRPTVSGKPSSSKVVKTIRHLVDNKHTFLVRTTVTAENVALLPNFIEYFGNLGVSYIRFEKVNPWGVAKDNSIPLPTIEEYVYYFKKAADLSAEKGITLVNGVLLNFTNPSIHACPSMSGRETIVLPDGLITGCYAVYNKKHPLADRFIIGEWNNQSKCFIINRESLQQLQSHNVENIPACSSCFAKYICSGGCPLAHWTDTGINDFSILSPHWCDLMKAHLKNTILRCWEIGKP